MIKPSSSAQLVEAYATVIECCQLFDFKYLSNYYTEKAFFRYVQMVLYHTYVYTNRLDSLYISIRCSDIQFGIEDLPTYVHFLNVALSTKLCLGKMAEAMELGM